MVMQPARRIYHAFRLAPERLMHQFRHRAAIERQQTAGQPGQVLILCYGNICRSPYAEAKLRHLLDVGGYPKLPVTSAGFFGPGRRANEAAQRAARARNADLSGHRSRLLNPDLAEQGALILTMTAAQAALAADQLGPPARAIEVLGDLDPEGVRQRGIPDPYGQPPEFFERVFDRIDRCLSTLVQAWDR